MPVYEYECPPCLTIYQVRQRMNDPPLDACPKCRGGVSRIISAPNLNRYNFASPTEAKYSKLSLRDEMTKEAKLQAGYQTIWLPPPVKHNPWEED